MIRTSKKLSTIVQIFEIFEYKLKIIFEKNIFKINYIFYWKIFIFRKKSSYTFCILSKYYMYIYMLYFWISLI